MDDPADDVVPVVPESSPPGTGIPPRRSVGRNAFALLVSQSFTWVLATIVTTIQPRFLGPVGLGQLRLGTAVWAVIEIIAAFGTSTLMQLEIARDPSIAGSLSKRVLRMRLVMCAILSPFVAVFLWIADYDRTTLVVMSLIGVSTLFTIATSCYRSVMYGLREMGKTSRVDVISKLVLTIGVIAILSLGGGVIELCICGIVLAVFGSLLFRRAYERSLPPNQRESPLIGRSLIRAGATFLVADAALVVYLQIDTVVISLVTGSKEIGWYATADVLFGSILFLPVILTTALFPAIADLHHRDPAEVDRMLVRTFRSLMLCAVPVGVGTVIVAKPLVSLLYGPKFDGSTPVLEVYGVVSILSFLTILLGRFAFATGRGRLWNIFMLCSIGLSIVLDLVLVPWADRRFDNGAIGGPLAYIVTESLSLTAGLLFLSRSILSRNTLFRALRCLVGAAAMILVGWPLRDQFFLIPGLVSLLAYGAVIAATRVLDPDERRQLHKLLTDVRSRVRPRGATRSRETQDQ